MRARAVRWEEQERLERERKEREEREALARREKTACVLLQSRLRGYLVRRKVKVSTWTFPDFVFRSDTQSTQWKGLTDPPTLPFFPGLSLVLTLILGSRILI